MKIIISDGTGEGPNSLAAFDAALIDANIANYNLIKLSSVIPPNTELILDKTKIQENIQQNWGNRLYVVIAEAYATIPGEEAWAGLGWVIDSEEKKGLFVEHHGSSRSEVESDINLSLKTLTTNRGMIAGKFNIKLSHIVCKDKPVCSVAVAVYKSENW